MGALGLCRLPELTVRQSHRRRGRKQMPIGSTHRRAAERRPVQRVVQGLEWSEYRSERAIEGGRASTIEEGRKLGQRLAEPDACQWRHDQVVDTHHLAHFAEVYPEHGTSDGKAERFTNAQVVAARRPVINVSTQPVPTEIGTKGVVVVRNRRTRQLLLE